MTDRTRLRDTKKREKAAKHGYLTVHQLLDSGVADAYRNVRTKLVFSSPDKELKTVLVTSSFAKEGKSFSAISLAVVMARAGKNVLLLDADLRKPTLGKAFSIGSQGKYIGLTGVIMKQVSLEDAIIKTPVENVSLLPAGPKPPGPSELLGSKSMEELLERLRSDFDIVILDTPPVLGIPDVVTLASKVDGCLLVVKFSKTSYKAVIRAKESLETANGRILGVILNQVKEHGFMVTAMVTASITATTRKKSRRGRRS
jgi:capsular exopolysaccharide synthesis family protein